MTQASQLVLDMTNASRTDYFSDQQQVFFALKMKVNAELAAFAAPPTELLVLNGPDEIDLEKRTDLPAIVVRYANGMRNWQISHALNAYILMQDLNGGALQSRRLVLPGVERAEPPPPSGSGPKPTGADAEGTSTSLARYLLRQQLHLQWRPARIALTLIDYDAISNSLLVNLKQKAALDNPPAPAIVAPSDFLKSSPASTPSQKGIGSLSISVESSSTARSVSVKGFVNAPAASLSTAASRAGVATPDVILATLLFVKLDQPPIALNLAIPATNSGNESGKQTLSTQFELNAATRLPVDMPAGLYQIYLLSGLNKFGPVAVSIAPSSSPGSK